MYFGRHFWDFWMFGMIFRIIFWADVIYDESGQLHQHHKVHWRSYSVYWAICKQSSPQCLLESPNLFWNLKCEKLLNSKSIQIVTANMKSIHSAVFSGKMLIVINLNSNQAGVQILLWKSIEIIKSTFLERFLSALFSPSSLSSPLSSSSSLSSPGLCCAG